MRAYYFGNMYLSSIQQGIQALHATTEMFVKYKPSMVEYATLMDWASLHKTVICLNAGYSSEIRDLSVFFSRTDNVLPWATFNEEQAALDSALTCIAIVLPEIIYDTDNFMCYVNDDSSTPNQNKRLRGMEALKYVEINDVILWHSKDRDDGPTPVIPLSAFEKALAIRIKKYQLAK